MLITVATIALVASFVAFVYYLGMVQGRYVERSRTRKRFTKQEWMLHQALERWSPWHRPVAESRARLASEYDHREEKTLQS